MTDRHPELVLPEEEIQRRLRRSTRRGFLIGGIAAAGTLAGYKWVTTAADDNEIPWPQRRVLDFNGTLSHSYLSDSHLMPTYSRERVGWLKPNGNIGLEQPLDAGKWQLQLETGREFPPLHLTLADVMALPKVEMITQFCCIEGWSTVAHWGGARFSDFTKKYFPPDRKLPDFVYMATAREDYYVGLDMKSALHPQTLLAYEQDGKPLEERHGAPLRLVIPVKYGIKNIKRVALVRYTNRKPGDYWAEEGYDWFAGL